MPFGVGMTTVRPGWTRTGGIGPKIRGAWERYFDDIPKGAVGVDSFGNLIKTDVRVGRRRRGFIGLWLIYDMFWFLCEQCSPGGANRVLGTS